jgi:hypothetical protein
MNASQIIESCTRQATVDGSTSYPALCDLYERQIRILGSELAVLKAQGQSPARGCGFYEGCFGAANALIEYEYEAGGGDGWNEPSYEAKITILRVFLNGVWCDAEDVASEKTQQRWIEEIWAERADAEDAAAEDAAEARAEMLRDWALEEV